MQVLTSDRLMSDVFTAIIIMIFSTVNSYTDNG